ncbi:NAD(P)/FAD-dependent oxidoreductase [Seongchinamella unica]|nr:FAD-dependent monooxygenase [Seongchinamella unica]
MNHRIASILEEGAVVAIIGGGPAGAFTALHLLQMARRRGLQLNVLIFERRLAMRESHLHYEGCPQCAGGLSPRLCDALDALNIELPAEVVQLSIDTITLEGRWKNLHLAVPPDRRMLTVYRGTLPRCQALRHQAFDALLLDKAELAGATVIAHQVEEVSRDHLGKPVLTVREQGSARPITADFVVFATGINDSAAMYASHTTGRELYTRLCEGYRPPRLRKALIFELEGHCADELREGELHYVECSEGGLDLEMCSILPKREYLTVSLIGHSVDSADSHQDNLELIRRFLAVPRIRRSLPQGCSLTTRCACSPRIVVGMARHPFGDRVAAVGDMVTCRQYKDGILSAHSMARSLAATLLDEGVDKRSLRRGYRRTLRRFQRDNHYATVIFALYRLFFTNRFLSRVLYQTYSSEQKNRAAGKRHFERLLWVISSGEESYRRILWWMIRPRMLWQIFSTGFLVTLRSSAWERVFGLKWRDLGRFPVVVKREDLLEKLAALPTIQSRDRVYLYGIDVKRPPLKLLKVLHQFGEPGRPFLTPRMVNIRRREGCFADEDVIIDYRIFGGLIQFEIDQISTGDPHTIHFRVLGGFAHDGDFIFSVEPASSVYSRLSVLLSFNYPKGNNPLGSLFWRLFALLFPQSIHEIIWNHALCEIKQATEQLDPGMIASVPEHLTG